jgi:serine/threonine protein kinase
VTAAGHVRLLDFGIAKLLDDQEPEGAPLRFYTRALTPDYASPELLQGDAVDSRTDVYSLGALLYEMLSGNRPYRLAFAASPSKLAAELGAVAIVLPSEAVVPGAGPPRATTDDRLAGRLRGELDAIVLKALAFRREQRYESVDEMSDDLQRYLRGERVLALEGGLKAEDVVAQLSRNPNVRVRHGVPPRMTRAESKSAPSGVARARRVLVSADLLGPEPGSTVWSRTFHVTLRDGFNVEDEVATTILEAVRAALDAETRTTPWRLRVELAASEPPADGPDRGPG